MAHLDKDLSDLAKRYSYLAPVHIAALLREHIEANNLWSDLARSMGTTVSKLQKTLSRSGRLSANTFFELLRYLHVDIRFVPRHPENVIPEEEQALAANSSVFNTVSTILRNQLGISINKEIYSTTDVFDLGGDSLDLVEIVMCLEGYYCIEIPDVDFQDGLTVGALVEIIEKRVNNK